MLWHRARGQLSYSSAAVCPPVAHHGGVEAITDVALWSCPHWWREESHRAVWVCFVFKKRGRWCTNISEIILLPSLASRTHYCWTYIHTYIYSNVFPCLHVYTTVYTDVQVHSKATDPLLHATLWEGHVQQPPMGQLGPSNVVTNSYRWEQFF